MTRAENRELTLAETINPKKPTKGDCYLALTFGTLLSSQGTDAQQHHPHGLRHRRLCPNHTTRRAGPQTFPAATLRRSRAAHRRPYTSSGTPAQGVPEPRLR